jgi:hypothetical protein
LSNGETHGQDARATFYNFKNYGLILPR